MSCFTDQQAIHLIPPPPRPPPSPPPPPHPHPLPPLRSSPPSPGGPARVPPGQHGGLLDTPLQAPPALPPSPNQVVASLSRGGLPEFLLGSVAGFLTHHCKRPVAVLHGLRDSAGRYSFEAALPPRVLPVPASADSTAATPAGGSTAASPPGSGGAACPTHMAADSAAAGIATAAAAPAAETVSAGKAPATNAPASAPATETAGKAPAATPASETVSAGRNLLVPVEGSDESLVSCRWTLDHLYRPGEWTLERR